MDSYTAFRMGEMSRHKEPMVFDWNKAARRIKEVQPKKASAGLGGDWECTGGQIYSLQQGAIKNRYTYLASPWATPVLEMDGEVEDCYLMQSDRPNWNEKTKWPKSALKILEEKR